MSSRTIINYHAQFDRGFTATNVACACKRGNIAGETFYIMFLVCRGLICLLYVPNGSS